MRGVVLSDIHHNLKKSMKVTTKAIEEGQASTTALNVLAMEKIGVLFAAVTIFFRAVWQYCKIVNRTDEQGTVNHAITAVNPDQSEQKYEGRPSSLFIFGGYKGLGAGSQ